MFHVYYNTKRTKSQKRVLRIYVYLGVNLVYSEYARLALSKEKCKYLSTFGLACSTRVVEVRIVLGT